MNLEEFVSLAEKRVADAQAALRNRPAGNLPARPTSDAPPEAWEAYREAHGLQPSPARVRWSALFADFNG